jgi:hypothetical protein
MFWCIFVPICASSCRRSAPVAPPPPSQSLPIAVNLNYPQETTTQLPTTTFQNKFELILSETSGKVLLDTLAPLNTNVSATVYANDTLIDVTSIVYDSVSQRYRITTYRAVNPTHWVTAVNEIVQLELQAQAGEEASLLYVNAPSTLESSRYFNSGVGHGPIAYQFSANDMLVNYTQVKSTYTYLWDPGDGLYKFYLPVSLSDTVDLSTMDTVRNAAFIIPAGNHLVSFELDAVMDTTDLSKTLSIYNTTNPGLNSPIQ